MILTVFETCRETLAERHNVCANVTASAQRSISGRSAGRNSAGPEPPATLISLSVSKRLSLVQADPVVELKVNGSRDIDAGEDDPQLASSYVTDIHQHMLSMEVRR